MPPCTLPSSHLASGKGLPRRPNFLLCPESTPGPNVPPQPPAHPLSRPGCASWWHLVTDEQTSSLSWPPRWDRLPPLSRPRGLCSLGQRAEPLRPVPALLCTVRGWLLAGGGGGHRTGPSPPGAPSDLLICPGKCRALRPVRPVPTSSAVSDPGCQTPRVSPDPSVGGPWAQPPELCDRSVGFVTQLVTGRQPARSRRSGPCWFGDSALVAWCLLLSPSSVPSPAVSQTGEAGGPVC